MHLAYLFSQASYKSSTPVGLMYDAVVTRRQVVQGANEDKELQNMLRQVYARLTIRTGRSNTTQTGMSYGCCSVKWLIFRWPSAYTQLCAYTD